MANDSPQVKVTVAQAIRDVFIAMINRGQFLMVLGGLILVILAVRIDPDVLVELIRHIFSLLLSWWFLGYTLFLATLAFGQWYIRSLNSKHTQQLAALQELGILEDAKSVKPSIPILAEFTEEGGD